VCVVTQVDRAMCLQRRSATACQRMTLYGYLLRRAVRKAVWAAPETPGRGLWRRREGERTERRHELGLVVARDLCRDLVHENHLRRRTARASGAPRGRACAQPATWVAAAPAVI